MHQVPRVAILSSVPTDSAVGYGGVEAATLGLLEGLRAYCHEFEFHVISLAQDLAADCHVVRDGIHFHYLRTPGGVWLRPRMILRAIRTHHELRHIKPDLIHCQSLVDLGLAAVASGCRTIFTLHGVADDEVRFRTGWQFWSVLGDYVLGHIVLRRSTSFVCISSYARRFVGANKPTFMIPNAVSSRFLQLQPRVESESAPRITFLGTLAPLKRPHDLLLAHAELQRDFPQLETVLCGGVEDHAYALDLRRLVAERRLTGVMFFGTLGPARVASLLAESSVLVLPSAQENAPMALLEAMAAGVPVVATRVGGVADLVQHGEVGFLYECGDIRALVDNLRRLLVDPPLRQRLGRAGRERAQNVHSPDRVAAATVAAYRSLLGVTPCGMRAEEKVSL